MMAKVIPMMCMRAVKTNRDRTCPRKGERLHGGLVII
jgi:hypothetical protein